MLFDRLSDYDKQGMTPLHMPDTSGTRRSGRRSAVRLITELPGFDNLQAPAAY
jgi:hypothetical protein